MANIGTLAIVVSANAAQATPGLEAAAHGVERLGKVAQQTDSKAAGSFASIGASAAKMGGRLASFSAGGILGQGSGLSAAVHSLLSSVPLIGGALAAIPLSGAAFMSFLQEGIAHLKETKFRADELGVSTQTMGGIMLLAGAHSEAMERGLFKLNEKLGEAAAGSLDAQDNFTKLGFSAQALSKLSGDDRLAVIMDHLHGIADASQRAHVAAGLLGGKVAHELLPILSKGSGALAEAKRQATVLGLSFSEEAADGALKAAGAMRTVDMAVKGLGMQLAIAAGPLLDEFLNPKSISKFLEEMGGIPGIVEKLGDAVMPVFAAISDAIGDAATFARELKGALEGLSLMPIIGITRSASNSAPPATVGEGIMAGWEKTKAAMHAAPKNGPAMNFDETMRPAIDQLEIQLRRSIQTWQMSSREIEVWKMAQAGASKQALETARSLDIQLTKQENQHSREQEALGIVAQTKSPYDKFEEQLQNINSLKADGLLTDQEAAEAIAKQVDELKAATDLHGKGPEALTVGSREAMNTLAQTQNQSRESGVEGLLKAGLEYKKAHLSAAERTARAVEKFRVVSMP